MSVEDLVAAVMNADCIGALEYALNELQSYAESRRKRVYSYVNIDVLPNFGGEEPPWRRLKTMTTDIRPWLPH